MKDYLNRYMEKDIYPFHMPGHKRNEEFLTLEKEALHFDVTEFEGMDNLHDAQGFILDSQKKCAALWGADESFYLVNGSTSGIAASILACCKRGEEILIGRNCHKSVHTGLIYSGAVPKYIYPAMTDYGFSAGICPEELNEILNKNKKIKAVLITSPTYEGIVSRIEEISDVCHEKNVILIVDEAHGAHFKFDDYFPKSALEMGADIVIQSFHKTLPAFTQSAVLHVKGERVHRKILKKHLTMIQSSSPSYVLMAGLDNCVRLISNRGAEVFEKYTEYLRYTRHKLSDCKNMVLISGYDEKTVYDQDMGKLVFYLKKDCSGHKIEEILREKYKIQAEMSSKFHLILMTSIADTLEGFQRLINAVMGIDLYLAGYNDRKTVFDRYPRPVYRMHPSQAIYEQTVSADINEGLGKISSEFITPYPPGIPLLAPGEEITQDLIDYVNQIYNGYKIEIIREQ